MNGDKVNQPLETIENKYHLVLAAAKRSHQLLDRAEKHGMSADTEKVILQSLEEVVIGKVTYTNPPVPDKKKKTKE